MSREWFAQRERGSPFAIRTILWIARHVGRGGARILLYPITAYFLITATGARRASRDYLNRILERPATLLDVMRHLNCFSATILDRVFFLSGQFQRFDIRVHGLEQVRQRLGNRRGLLMLGAHLGSFEVLRVLAVEHLHKDMKVLMYPDQNQYLTRLFNALNPALAETVIPMGDPDTLLKVKEELDDGKIVGLLGDRVAESEKVTRCNFLGEAATFPTGPMLAAGILGAPVVLVLGIYRGGRQYDIYFELLAESIRFNRAERDTEVQQWTRRYVRRLEHYVKLAPYNWFNFYDYWN